MKWILWIVILALLGAGGYAGYLAYAGGSKPQAGAYRTAAVQRTDIVASISANGTVVPEEVVDVGAQVNGQIASFGLDTQGKPVDYRSTVQEGGVLAKIDDALYAADVASNEAQLGQAQAQVKVSEATHVQAAAKLEQAKRDWERAQKLGESRALSQVDYDAAKSGFEQAQAGLALAQSQIDQAKSAVAIAEAALMRSRRNLAYCIIKSPVSGVVIDRRVDIGQTVVASLNAPSLFLLAKDLKRMRVLAQVNEADVGKVQPGKPVTFTVDAFPNDTFKGEVKRVRLNATMTQNVVTYTVEISADNPELKLLPYLTANVLFEVSRREQVLAVPSAALRWSPPGEGGAAAPAVTPTAATQPAAGVTPHVKRAGHSGVWVLGDAGLRRVGVRAGLSDGSLTEVTSDELKEGDQVVIGELAAAAGRSAADAGGTTNPFTPNIRGRRGGH